MMTGESVPAGGCHGEKTLFRRDLILLPTRESRKDSARGISWDLPEARVCKLIRRGPTARVDPTASCTGTTRDPVGARAAPRAVSCQKRDLKSCDPDSAGGSGLGGLACRRPGGRPQAGPGQSAVLPVPLSSSRSRASLLSDRAGCTDRASGPVALAALLTGRPLRRRVT
jgi:hypothetical protein